MLTTSEVAAKLTMALKLKGFSDQQAINYGTAIANSLPERSLGHDPKMVKVELRELADSINLVATTL